MTMNRFLLGTSTASFAFIVFSFLAGMASAYEVEHPVRCLPLARNRPETPGNALKRGEPMRVRPAGCLGRFAPFAMGKAGQGKDAPPQLGHGLLETGLDGCGGEIGKGLLHVVHDPRHDFIRDGGEGVVRPMRQGGAGGFVLGLGDWPGNGSRASRRAGAGLHCRFDSWGLRAVRMIGERKVITVIAAPSRPHDGVIRPRSCGAWMP